MRFEVKYCEIDIVVNSNESYLVAQFCLAISILALSLPTGSFNGRGTPWQIAVKLWTSDGAFLAQFWYTIIEPG